MRRIAIRSAILLVSPVTFGIPTFLAGWLVWYWLPLAVLAGIIFGAIAASLPSRVLAGYASPPWWTACARIALIGCAAAILSCLIVEYSIYPLHKYGAYAPRMLSAYFIPDLVGNSSLLMVVGAVGAMVAIPILKLGRFDRAVGGRSQPAGALQRPGERELHNPGTTERSTR